MRLSKTTSKSLIQHYKSKSLSSFFSQLCYATFVPSFFQLSFVHANFLPFKPLQQIQKEHQKIGVFILHTIIRINNLNGATNGVLRGQDNHHPHELMASIRNHVLNRAPSNGSLHHERCFIFIACTYPRKNYLLKIPEAHGCVHIENQALIT